MVERFQCPGDNVGVHLCPYVRVDDPRVVRSTARIISGLHLAALCEKLLGVGKHVSEADHWVGIGRNDSAEAFPVALNPLLEANAVLLGEVELLNGGIRMVKLQPEPEAHVATRDAEDDSGQAYK